FDAVAARSPAAIAITVPAAAGRAGETIHVTYAELNARANRLARRLRAHGVGRGALVALFVDRGAELIAAILAILKSGAGYVPIDPAYPADRVRFMIDDAGAAAVVTERRLPAARPPGVGSRRRCRMARQRRSSATTGTSLTRLTAPANTRPRAPRRGRTMLRT